MFIWKFVTQFCKYHGLLSFHKLLGNAVYKLQALCIEHECLLLCLLHARLD